MQLVNQKIVNSSQMLRTVMKTGNVRERVMELYMLEMIDIEILKGEIYVSVINKIDIATQVLGEDLKKRLI